LEISFPPLFPSLTPAFQLSVGRRGRKKHCFSAEFFRRFFGECVFANGETFFRICIGTIFKTGKIVFGFFKVEKIVFGFGKKIVFG
jgi:hypothetical protein